MMTFGNGFGAKAHSRGLWRLLLPSPGRSTRKLRLVRPKKGHKRLYHFHALGMTATLWAGALTPLINLLGETRLYGFTTPPRGTLSREPIVDAASERAASTVNHSDFVFARSMIWSLSSKLFSCH
jgi:hypothetical protein